MANSCYIIESVLAHSKTKLLMRTTFRNIDSQQVREAFTNVLHSYQSLHTYEIILEQKPVKGSTMQAQPVISWRSLLGGISKYKVSLAVYVRDSKQLKVNELPQDVLTGWFAHELGHVVDYEAYSTLSMIGYGIRYLLSDSFKRKVEHQADYIAIRNGFRAEIIAAKRFILENELLDDAYKSKIRKYYMGIDEAETWQHNAAPGTPTADL